MSHLTVEIKQHTPVITERDVSSGFIYRFFAAKANQTRDKVYEVDRREYTRLLSNPYVVLVRLRWKIVGSLEDLFVPIHTGNILGEAGTEIVRIPGLLTENESSVIFASERIPALSRMVTNFKEFYQNGDEST